MNETTREIEKEYQEGNRIRFTVHQFGVPIKEGIIIGKAISKNRYLIKDVNCPYCGGKIGSLSK